MTATTKLSVAALLMLAALLFSPAARAAGLIEEETGLRVAFGDRTLVLDALIVRPDGDRPRPLVLISHGAPRDAATRAGMNPRAMRAQAREFARRGWVAVSFMRRGYGESEGQYAESSGGCANPDYRNSGRQSAQDLRGVIAAMKQKPYVDASRIVSVGRSAGGFATLALTADPPAGLVAAINFAAGRGSQKPDEVCQPDRLVEAFGHFGRTSRIPTLWVYSENDHYFNPKLAKRFHQAFTGAGGKAELVIAAPFGEDGHSLFSEKGVPVWTGLVDPFLARHKLKLVDQLLPLRDEASVHYPNGLGARGKEAFLKYLDEDGQKAFAMSRDGFFGWRSRQKNAQAAIEGALENCRKVTQNPCTPVMINDRPVQ